MNTNNQDTLHANKTVVKRLSREEIAAIEVGHTTISGAAAKFLTFIFLLLIFGIPITQFCYEHLQWLRERNEASAVSSQSWRQRYSSVASANILPTVQRWRAAHNWAGLTALNAGMLKEINRFETRLEEDSLLQKWFIPPTQWVLTGWLRSGNEKGYCGHDRWLFYRPGIDLVTGKGFLNERVMAARRRSGKAWERPPQPDPLPAIIDFRDQLKKFGAELIVVPVPVKPMIAPERFSSRFSQNTKPLFNPSHRKFIEQLQKAEVNCLDLSDDLFSFKTEFGQDSFLKTDTHWTPAAMQVCATQLATMIKEKIQFADIAQDADINPGKYKRVSLEMTRHGDVLDMLRLPASQPFYKPQTVTIEQIQAADGKLWQADAGAEILLMGDSFANIYSLADMGWGAAAGLTEHLSVELGRGVDRIAMNDNGAYATRQELATILRRGAPRLAGKRVVVWEFAARELAVGDWRLIDLGEPRKAEITEKVTANQLKVSAVVKSIPAPPVPGNVPYQDAVIGMHLEILSVENDCTNGISTGDEVLAYGWVMRANKLTRLARLQTGARLSLTLIDWNNVSRKYGSFNRLEPDDPMVLMLDPYWIEGDE